MREESFSGAVVMTVDLEALDIVSLTIFGFFECSPEQEAALTEKVRTYRKGWPRSPLTKIGLDVHEDFERHVDFSLRRGPRRSGLIQVRLQAHPLEDGSLTRRTRERQSREFQELSDVMTFIEHMDIETRCHAHVNWEYEPGSYDTIVKLPMLVTSGPGLPFEHISGVRFIRQSEGGDISIIIDRARGGRLVATAQIPLSNNLSLALVDEVTLMAAQIIEDFVFEGLEEVD